MDAKVGDSFAIALVTMQPNPAQPNLIQGHTSTIYVWPSLAGFCPPPRNRWEAISRNSSTSLLAGHVKHSRLRARFQMKRHGLAGLP